jgi:hypothetical protein
VVDWVTLAHLVVKKHNKNTKKLAPRYTLLLYENGGVTA